MALRVGRRLGRVLGGLSTSPLAAWPVWRPAGARRGLATGGGGGGTPSDCKGAPPQGGCCGGGCGSRSGDEEAAKASFLQAEEQIGILQADVRELVSVGKLDEAWASAEVCAALAAEHFGTKHPVYASAVNNKALILKEQGKLEESLPLYQEALGIYTEILGEEHSSVASLHANVGLLFKRMAETGKGPKDELHLAADTAVEHLQKALAIRRRLLDSDDPQIAVALHQLASAVRIAQGPTAAEKLAREAVDRLRAKPGTMHRLTATAINNLAYILKERKRFDDAETLYREAHFIRSSLLGPTHPDSIASLYNLSELFVSKDDAEAAVKVQEEILQLLNVKPDEGEPDIEAIVRA